MKVKDILQEFILLTDSQDIEYVYDTLDTPKEDRDAGCIFVKDGNGEYAEVYKCLNAVPYLNCDVFKIKQKVFGFFKEKKQ